MNLIALQPNTPQTTRNERVLKFWQMIAPHRLPLLVLIAVATFGVLFATHSGLNQHYDDAYYVSYAQSIHAGAGLSLRVSTFSDSEVTSWLQGWPPLYPILLAVGGDVYNWARVLDVLTLALCVCLTYAIGFRVIRQRWAAFGAGLIFLTLPTIFDVFSSALTETLFAALSLGIVLLMTNYRFGVPQRSLRPALYAFPLAVGATLTRYLGVAIVGGMIVYCILWGLSVRGWRRWLPALTFILSLIPLCLYALYLYGLTGSFTGTQQTGDPLKFSHIPESLRQIVLELLHGGVFLGNLVGIRTNWWIVVVAAVLVVAAIAVAWRQREHLRGMIHSGDALLIVYVGTYLVGYWVLAARSAAILAQLRHYVVIFPALLILIFHLLAILRVNRAVIGVGVVLYLASGIAALQTTAAGLGWHSPAWQADPIIRDLPNLIPPGALIHGDESSYFSAQLGPDVTIRTFGGEAGFRDYQCTDLVYPEGYSEAVFTVFDSILLRHMTTDEARDFFVEWASPCGTVEKIVNDSFAMVMVVHLDGR